MKLENQIKQVILMLLCLALLILALSVFNLQPNNSPVPDQLDNNIGDEHLMIWTFGTNDLIESLQTSPQAEGTRVTSLSIEDFNLNSEIRSMVLNKSSIIIFDSIWLNQNDNQATYDFVNASASKVGSFFAVGGSNAKLYEILEKADVYTMCRDDNGIPRNPASHGMPIVGFRLQLVRDIEGTQHFVTGHYGSGNLNDPGLLKSIVAFLNHDGR